MRSANQIRHRHVAALSVTFGSWWSQSSINSSVNMSGWGEVWNLGSVKSVSFIQFMLQLNYIVLWLDHWIMVMTILSNCAKYMEKRTELLSLSKVCLQFSHKRLFVHNTSQHEDMHAHTHTHSLSGWALGVSFGAKPQQPQTRHGTEGSICSKWPPARLKWLDRHHSLSAHLSAWQAEYRHKEWIHLDPERKEEEAAGERESDGMGALWKKDRRGKE